MEPDWDSLTESARRVVNQRDDLLAALGRAAETFSDFEKVNRILNRTAMAESAHIAAEDARAAIARATGKE